MSGESVSLEEIRARLPERIVALLAKALPERLECPGEQGRPVERERCLNCAFVIGQCAVTLPYVPTSLLPPPVEPEEEASPGGLGAGRAEAAPAPESTARLAEAPRLPPIEIDPETRLLLGEGAKRGAGKHYPTPEASRQARRIGTEIWELRSEVRLAAQAGDRAAYDRARAKLADLIARREALRETPAQPATEPPIPALTCPRDQTLEFRGEDGPPPPLPVDPALKGQVEELLAKRKPPPALKLGPEVVLRIDGVLPGLALQQALDGLGRSVGTGYGAFRRWRARVEIAPVGEEEEA